jgi:hypothetical protein
MFVFPSRIIKRDHLKERFHSQLGDFLDWYRQMTHRNVSRHEIYRSMYNAGGIVNNVRTMNNPTGQNAGAGGNPDLGNVDLSLVNFQATNAGILPNIHPEIANQLNFFTATFYDHSTRTFAVVNDGITSPDILALKLQLLHHAFTFEHGIFRRWSYLRRLPAFSTKGGPIVARCKRDLLLCAALVCCQAAMDNGDGYFMCASTPRCKDWSETEEGRPRYDRARATACIIESKFRLPQNPSFDGVITVQNIMDVNIHGTLSRLRKQLHRHGVVSEYGEGVNSAGDILEGVYFPTFLFLDSLLGNRFWRDLLPVDKEWICREEIRLYQANVRLVTAV